MESTLNVSFEHGTPEALVGLYKADVDPSSELKPRTSARIQRGKRKNHSYTRQVGRGVRQAFAQ